MNGPKFPISILKQKPISTGALPTVSDHSIIMIHKVTLVLIAESPIFTIVSGIS